MLFNRAKRIVDMKVHRIKEEKPESVGLCNEPDTCTFFQQDWRPHYHKANHEVELLERKCDDSQCVYYRYTNTSHYHTSEGKVVDGNDERINQQRDLHEKAQRNLINDERLKLLGLDYLNSMVFIDGETDSNVTPQDKITKWNAYITELNKISERCKQFPRKPWTEARDDKKIVVEFTHNIEIKNTGEQRLYRAAPNLEVNTSAFSRGYIESHDTNNDVTETIRLPIMFMRLDNKWLEVQTLQKVKDMLSISKEETPVDKPTERRWD